ncbi:MAG: PAS domain S-box protein, partial [Candidatus Thorarchaeota archaeon]
EEGGTKRATGTLLDITERKVFEKALQQSEEKYRNLLENIPQRVFFKDKNSVYVAVNPSFASLLGVSPSEVLGKTDYDFFPKDLADQYRAKDVQVLETLETLEYEELFIENGEERIAHTVKAPVRDDEGTVVGLLGIFWDITESKRSAEVLREQESRYRTIVEQFLMGIAIVPRGFQSIAFVNPKICDILGYSQDELLSLSPEDVSALVHPDDVAQIDDYLNNRLKDKAPGEPIQIRMFHKDGSEIWADFSAGGIEYGDVPAVQASVIDITKRIKAETEVLRDRQVFRSIAEGAIQAKDTGELSLELLKGIISSLDFDFGTIRLYDEKNNVLRFAALEGIEISDTREELPLTQEFGDDYIIVHAALNKTPELITNVHDEAPHKSYLKRLKKFGAASSVAYPILDDDLNLLGVMSLATHTPRTYSEGDRELFSTIVNMLGSVLERKRAEKALQISERRYRELLTNISEGMAIADLDENILFVNNAFADMLGYSRDELLGTSILDIIVDEDKEKILSQTKKRRNGESTSYTHGFVTKDGGKRIVRVSAVPSRDDDGQVDGTIAVVTDITERIQKDEEIQRLNEELAQRVEERTAELAAANKELEAFSYSVSHDLRAPLRTIDGFSQALLEDYSDSIDSTGKDFLHRVRAAATHMASLIEDLLMLSRVARAEMDREDVDLSEIAREIIDEFQEVEPEREVTAKISEDIHAHCDQRLIRLVLQNLLENAWKFTSKASDAQIEFGCIEKDEATQFYIKDNGAGFNMDYSDKLFIPFQRLHQSEDFPGSGIGLATVQRIINRHGGKVWADSVIEEGSTFYFTIPESRGVD